MGNAGLEHDPYNLIITGVGGQGNVLASRMIGDMMSQMGFYVTIGETFGASQRGGSVMSHLRISKNSSYSPQIPRGTSNMVVALEPTEALRVLKDYGNPDVRVLCNTRPIYSVGVICGEHEYPAIEELKKWIEELSERSWFIDATHAALELGDPIFGNIICVGALAATEVLPLNRDSFEAVLAQKMGKDKCEVNLSAYDIGVDMVRSQ
jgi:indolepyruvate ferredoxin oxidoreductase beta subunit